MGVCSEVLLDGRVITYVRVGESFPDIIHDTVGVLLVGTKPVLKSIAKIRGIRSVAGIAWLRFETASEDLLFEAVEPFRDALEVESVAKGGGN